MNDGGGIQSEIAAIRRELERPPRLLLVEDSADDAALFRDLLSGFKADLTVEPTARGAVERISSVVFDLVFLDLALAGGGSGIEVLARMDETQNHTPVVILTGAMDERFQRELERHRVMTLLTKPASREAVEKVMRSFRLV